MKKGLVVCIALVMAGMLAACGGGKDTAGTGNDTAAVDLNGFYQNLEKTYEWDDGYMVEIEEDMLDEYYPGLRDIPKKQFVARAPMMSAVVNEIVFIETENAEDAKKAADILKARIEVQAEGGAWYPESMEAWGKGEVIQKGNYVAMIVTGENQGEIKAEFDKLFA